MQTEVGGDTVVMREEDRRSNKHAEGRKALNNTENRGTQKTTRDGGRETTDTHRENISELFSRHLLSRLRCLLFAFGCAQFFFRTSFCVSAVCSRPKCRIDLAM